ncbi:MAG: ribbon-helix-helix protein, CopG family [Chloroflexota bacterium]|nr:ribbon-helix-helix protein, CopG family [Gemmatimonadota bacterium]MDE2841490.1 ribbon-helix-helix protein, CopG family [Chloroflexota bacterium]
MALEAKKSTRSSEGKQAALDALSEEEKVRLNLDIPKSTMRQLKMRAVERETTVSEIVRELVAEYLSK